MQHFMITTYAHCNSTFSINLNLTNTTIILYSPFSKKNFKVTLTNATTEVVISCWGVKLNQQQNIGENDSKDLK